ncbi:MAG: cupin domain-containing protein [Promethearchaeota archaeon]
MEENSKIQTGNIIEKFTQFDDYWNPRIVGKLNGQMVKLVKFQGEFEWHAHDHEEEFFLVIQGNFTMEFRTHYLKLEKNDFVIVPKGVDHRPVAEDEVHLLLFEPESTLNTGNVQSEKTRDSLDHI